MENEQPKWPIFSNAEKFIISAVFVAVFSMAFIGNMNKSNVLSSVFAEPNPYADLNCDQLVEKINQSDQMAIDEFETRCLQASEKN